MPEKIEPKKFLKLKKEQANKSVPEKIEPKEFLRPKSNKQINLS